MNISVRSAGRMRCAVSACIADAGTDPGRTKGGRRPQSAMAPDLASGRLQRQSRVTNPERRPDDGYRQVIRSVRRRDDMP